ncbi:hypothetical protein JTB14_017353 [Gonioctena quinquepunctata]|nr:hypothetical protein JTB14_017353 [Gonioctena quinquepunctata]
MSHFQRHEISKSSLNSHHLKRFLFHLLVCKRKPKIQKSHTILTSTPNIQVMKNKAAPENPPNERKKRDTKIPFDSESDEKPFETRTQDDKEDCACVHCYDMFSHSNPRQSWLRCNN